MKARWIHCISIFLILCMFGACAPTQTPSDGNDTITVVRPSFNTARAEFSMLFHLSDTQFENGTGTTVTSIFKGAFTVTPAGKGYTLTLPELQISITSGDASLEFNAGATYTGEMAVRMIPFRALTETVFTAIPDETDHLEALGGFEEVITKIETETAPYGEKVKNQAISALQEFLNENTLCYLIEKLLFGIHEGTQNKNETHSRFFDGLAPYSYSIQDKITYTGRSGKADVFAIDGIVSSVSKDKADGLLQSGLPYYEMSGTTAGTCTLFTQGNLLRSGSSSGSATGICYFPDKTESNGVPVSISRQLTYSVHKVD